VQRWRIKLALGHKGYDRRYQGIAQLPCDRSGSSLQHHIVLARHQVRPVLFHATRGHNHRVLAGPHLVADFHPGQILDEYRVDRRDRARGVRVRLDRIRSSGGLRNDDSQTEWEDLEHESRLVGQKETLGTALRVDMPRR
jgi:hypothetical protein